MNPVSINFYKFVAKTAHDVDAICAPLKKHLDIGTFIYQRDEVKIADNKIVLQKRSGLVNNTTFIDYNFTQLNKFYDTYGIAKTTNYIMPELVFPATKEITDSWKTCQMHNIIMKQVLSENNSIIETFVFASSSPDRNIINFYINGSEFLNKFILYFKDVGKKLITQSNDAQNSGLYNHTFTLDLVNTKSILGNDKTKNSFLEQIKPKHFYIKNNSGIEVKIPSVEWQCLNLLAKGRSMKDIGNELDLSPRTVETNISRSKKRLQCYTKKNLLDLLEARELFA